MGRHFTKDVVDFRTTDTRIPKGMPSDHLDLFIHSEASCPSGPCPDDEGTTDDENANEDDDGNEPRREPSVLRRRASRGRGGLGRHGHGDGEGELKALAAV